jgi:hypothetical protein
MPKTQDRSTKLILVRNDNGEPQLCCCWEVEPGGLACSWHVVPMRVPSTEWQAVERWLPV